MMTMPKAPEDDSSTPYEVATNYLNTREIPGKKHNPVILRWLRKIGSNVQDDETAWCSTFINYCALVTGRERTGSLLARSWLKIGQRLELTQARRGDVIVLWRVSRSSWTGHVGFLDYYDGKRGLIYLLGGNQNNAVNITGYPVDQFLGARRLRKLSEIEGKSKIIV